VTTDGEKAFLLIEFFNCIVLTVMGLSYTGWANKNRTPIRTLFFLLYLQMKTARIVACQRAVNYECVR